MSIDWICFRKSSRLDEDVLELLEDVLLVSSVEELSPLSDGGGPGGGPPAPCVPPGPLANVCSKTEESSLAWSEVRVPASTCDWMRSEIFDCISLGDGGVVEEVLEERSLCSVESILVRAEVSASPSDELMLPELSIDCNVRIAGDCWV